MAAPSVSYATFFLRVSLEFGHVGFIFDGMRKENWDIDEINTPAPSLLQEPQRGMAPNIGIPLFYFIYRLK
ncbi:unnamed protein product [Rhizophagus irregularis]|nr:unnamed protein product [Rhizophagus irregularis]